MASFALSPCWRSAPPSSSSRADAGVCNAGATKQGALCASPWERARTGRERSDRRWLPAASDRRWLVACASSIAGPSGSMSERRGCGPLDHALCKPRELGTGVAMGLLQGAFPRPLPSARRAGIRAQLGDSSAITLSCVCMGTEPPARSFGRLFECLRPALTNCQLSVYP